MFNIILFLIGASARKKSNALAYSAKTSITK
jgi:hypothetical protein